MKKRFVALFIALLVLVGGALSACRTEQAGGEVSQPSSAKELLFEAMDIEIPSAPEAKAYRIEGTLESKSGEDTLKAELDLDTNAAAYDGDIIVTAGEDVMNLNICGNEEALFVLFKDFLEAPIVYPLAEEDIDPELGVSEAGFISSQAGEKAFSFTNALAALINSGKADALFTTGETDYLLPEGGAVKAKTAEFMLTDEKLAELELASEEFASYDFDISASAVFDESGKLLNVSGNGNIKFTVGEETEIEIVASLSGDSDSSLIKIDVTANESKIAEAKIDLKTVDGKESVKAVLKENAASTSPILAYESENVYGLENTETEAGKSGNGKFYTETKLALENEDLDEVEATKVEIPFEYKTEEDGSSTLTVKNVSFVEGLTVALDISGEINIKQNESGFDLKLSLSSELESMYGDLTLDLSFSEIEPFEFTEPEKLEAYDGEILTELEVRYPEIYDYLFGSDYDDGYDNGYDESINVENYPDTYTFYENGTGSYYISYKLLENDGSKAEIQLANGETLEIEYSLTENDTYLIKDKAYKLNFDEFSEIYYLESEDTIDVGDHLNSVIINFSPEYNEGFISTAFTYEADGDVYSITHANGDTETKTLLFDSDYYEYYFEGTLSPTERYVNVWDDDGNDYSFDLANGFCTYHSGDIFVDSYGSGEAIIVMPDGEKITVNYTEAVYDEEYDEYTLEIDGNTFTASKYDMGDDGGEFISLWTVFTCECHAMNESHVSGVYYYPAEGIMNVSAVLHFTREGDKYFITLPNGSVIEKTVLYDGENEAYYFE